MTKQGGDNFHGRKRWTGRGMRAKPYRSNGCDCYICVRRRGSPLESKYRHVRATIKRLHFALETRAGENL